MASKPFALLLQDGLFESQDKIERLNKWDYKDGVQRD